VISIRTTFARAGETASSSMTPQAAEIFRKDMGASGGIIA
jgi:hypothetical protein